ncbi:MAG TPA: hypothetical protein VE863_09785 [Pyrinomonadaceae bacterium]|jgi:hypothetical protein|nr:hypothetical protein [Pyrinomonadaceae bacterium]
MRLVVVVLIVCAAGATFARQERSPTPAVSVAFYDVLDLPARLDEPKLVKTESGYSLTCAVANRSEESLVGLGLTLMLVDASGNGRTTRLTWNEATAVAAYSIKEFEFHPSIKVDPKDTKLFLGIDEVIGRETIWRTVDADKLLRAYARGQHGLIPKVQKLQNKFDRETPRVRPLLSKP